MDVLEQAYYNFVSNCADFLDNIFLKTYISTFGLTFFDGIGSNTSIQDFLQVFFCQNGFFWFANSI